MKFIQNARKSNIFGAFPLTGSRKLNFIVKLRIPFTYLLVLVTAALFFSCSTKRDSNAARMYHNTTAHFNGYFNAEEIIKKSVTKFKEEYKEDYDKLLPIFIYGEEEQAKAAYAEMEKAIEKCEKVINRHNIKDEGKKNKKRPKLNKWIDENYTVIGKAYFYKKSYFKASDVFTFINRKYKDPDSQVSSSTWLARTYLAQNEYGKAIQALVKAEDQTEVSDKRKADFYQVWADVLIKQGKLPQAAEKLEKAIGFIGKKKDRARPHFILAQIYQQLNKSDEALTHYEMVVKSKPPYELEFYARINKALSYSRRGGSSDEIKKELFKMLNDDKNLNYKDQIYYALGDIALEEQQRPEALNYFEKSLQANVDNKRQKAKTFLRLADLYFDERQYINAQSYYDSTLISISPDHERYKIVKVRAESLTELVGYLNAIELEDSLSKICKLPSEQREKKLAAQVKKIEREKEAQRQKDIADAEKAQQNAVAGINGTFWIYNEALLKKGKSNFVDYWGERPLKDNWRLSSRLATSFGPGEESLTEQPDTTQTKGEATAEDKYKVPTVEELKSSLPCDDPSKLKKLVDSAAEGYYNAGVIYKERLDDEDNATSSWEQLIRNLDESAFHPTAHYQLFRTYLNQESSPGYSVNPFCSNCTSQYWGDEIKSKYPGSDWARLVDNPTYFDAQEMKKAEENAAYEKVYAMYNNSAYQQAISACNEVISTQPDNQLLCKYRLLRATCVGYSEASYGVKENYLKELNEVVKNCPSGDEAKRAEELIKSANAGSASSSNNTPAPKEDKAEIPSDSTKTDGTELPSTEGPFKLDLNAEHYFAMIVPVKGADVNKIKISIQDFNTASYASAMLKVNNNLLDKDNHLILVKSFKKIDEARDYMSTFTSDQTKLTEINAAGYVSVLISKTNYIALFKTKELDTYLQFYLANYL
jgi:tetratricopeptide (TPR) repeat protein